MFAAGKLAEQTAKNDDISVELLNLISEKKQVTSKYAFMVSNLCFWFCLMRFSRSNRSLQPPRLSLTPPSSRWHHVINHLLKARVRQKPPHRDYRSHSCDLEQAFDN
jgi:hypothetical protein